MSDNKQLLNESTVRRFMGLAGIGALSDTFVDKTELQEDLGDLGDIGDIGDIEDVADVGDIGSMEEAIEDEMAAGPPPGVGADEFGEEELDLDEPDLDEPDFDEEPAADVDLSAEEAQVLVDLGSRLALELEGEEGEEDEEGFEDELMGPEGEAVDAAMSPSPEMGMPPGFEEEPPLEEAFIRTLSQRVANRVKKEHVVDEVMKRVARRIRKK